MKTFFTALCTLLSIDIYSQSIQLKLYDLMIDNVLQTATPGTVAPNYVFHAQTIDSVQTKLTIDIKNVGSTTHTFNVKRYDMTLNIATAYADTASALFCFAGYCYNDTTHISPNTLPLRAGKSASDTNGYYVMLAADLDETSVVGFSYVKYTFFDVNNTSDSVQVSIKYNDPATVGIKGINKVLSTSFEIYPNPVHDNATLKISSLKSLETKFVLYNALGSIVYSKEISITEGKNTIPLNVQGLRAGIYIAGIRNGDSTITKKFVME